MSKPRLSFWQIWNMSFGFLGIQFGWGLQMANMSSIYQALGAKESELSLLWIAAPLTGLLVQPVVGYLSDRTWNGLGRRRPYFLFGSLLSTLALVAMPHSSALWMAVGLLWILDASINITMEPFRAFVGDKLPDEQRASGFAVQSLFIGLGAVIASALPWLLNQFLELPASAEGSAVSTAVRISFHVGAAALFLAVLYTVLTTPELPPEDIAAFEKWKRESAGVGAMFRETLHGIATMPRVMRQLAPAQFFNWMGLFCMWIYWTPAIARGVYGGDPANEAAWKSINDQAGPWTGICFAASNLVCFAFSFALMAMSRKMAAKHIHSLCLVFGGVGLLSAAWMSTEKSLLISMTGVGIAWASILSMPYAMLSKALPAEKMGFYMGVFNFFIVIPQVLISLLMGDVVGSLFGGDSMKAVMTGGVFMLIAAGLTQIVKDESPA